MSNRNRKHQKKPAYTGSPWAHESFDPSGFCPNPFMGNPMGHMMNQYMQPPYDDYGGGGQMYNRNYNNRENFGGGGRYQNQRNQNFYGGGGGQNRRMKNAGGRNNNFGRKRPNNESGGNRGGKKSKTSEPYNPAEPTGEEEEDNRKESESDNDQSSKFGANAPPQAWKYSKKHRRAHYCTVCEDDFAGSFLIHRRTKEHRKNRDKKFPRCRLCRKTFQGTKEFEEHGKTEEHKKVLGPDCFLYCKRSEDFQALKEQQLIHAALSDSEDEETSLKRYISTKQVEDDVPAEEEGATEGEREAVGPFHVIPLKVFFCKLCQKFFSNYTDGRQVHCRTPDHIEKYKVYFGGKEARAAERNRIKKEEQAAKKEQLKLEAAAKGEEKEENGEENAEEGEGDEQEAEEEQEAGEGDEEEGGEDDGAEAQEEEGEDEGGAEAEAEEGDNGEGGMEDEALEDDAA